MMKLSIHKGAFIAAWIRVRRLAVLVMAWSWLSTACHGANEQTGITNLADLNRTLETRQRLAALIEIEGTVWWSSTAEGRIILRDESAVVQLELNLPCRMPVLGERVILEGLCLAVKAGEVIKLSGVPVVDYDGIHDLDEKSGTVHLTAGRHPVRVAWFDRTKSQGLEVEYEGPDLLRQKIPDAALFRLETNAAHSTTNYVNGLNYRCYEGSWWRLLPNFDHIAALKSGVVDNFDISVRSRENHAGLYFSGFIKVPGDGDYTFYVRSDDGSRLFIGDSSLRIHSAGHAALPSPDFPLKKDLQGEEAVFKWSEIEGTVTSFHRSRGMLEVEVMTKLGLVTIYIAEDSDHSYTLMLQNRIRVRGLSRKIRMLDRGWIRGEFFAQRWEDVEQLYISPQIWGEYPLEKIGSLIPMEQSNRVGSVIHLRGEVVSEGAGPPMLLEDRTGRIILDGAVSGTRVGQWSDVLGRLALESTDSVLRCVHFRQTEAGDIATNRLSILTTAEQISQLSREEATRGYPVQIRGVITSIMDYEGDFEGLIIQDATRGMLVNTLELTGVYVGLGGNQVLGQPIDSFKLLLNSGSDVRILSRPPWWTLKRLMLFVGLLIGGFVAALVWINSLHSKVEERTQQLGDQIRKRQRVERQRAVDQERARLAHDLHDDLGSGLTEVNMLALLSTSPRTPAEEKTQYLDEMNKLLSRMVLSLDEIVWAENPKNDSISSLAGYFGAHAQRLLGMASVSCGLEVSADLPDQSLDPKFRQELFLAFKEAITNVIKHANAKKVWLRISIQGDDLIVMVADDGCGITPDRQRAGANGLNNMRERMRALDGYCTIESEPGKGTSVCLQASIRRMET